MKTFLVASCKAIWSKQRDCFPIQKLWESEKLLTTLHIHESQTAFRKRISTRDSLLSHHPSFEIIPLRKKVNMK